MMYLIEPCTYGSWKNSLRAQEISDALMMEKTRWLFQQLYSNKSEGNLKASNGWLHRFKKRHGIRQLSLQGESLS